ncbi:DUF1846 domain-containing protein [Candidatus Omnitrophota bacterium]
MKKGFDNEKYLAEQASFILERVKKFDHKLYLEFGGKLCLDYHAARVLPGYDPRAKIRLLKMLGDKIEIVFCVYAKDVEMGRLRGDFGMTYDTAALFMIDDLKDWGLDVSSVVLTRFNNESQAVRFKNRLERKGIAVYTHQEIPGYPSDVDNIVSEKGLGKNQYITSKKPIVIVTAPGPGSGKLATCLSQVYHDHKKGINSGYAKFETFPIWNLPLKHPVNVAYESATCDLRDFNLVDPFHLETYKEEAINYNRDVEAFPILKRILERIVGSGKAMLMYNSPTDMGVNRAGFGIVDDKIVQEAAKQEIIRRYFRYQREFMLGLEKKETAQRAKTLMEELGLKEENRLCVVAARKAAARAGKKAKSNNGISCGAAIELGNAKIVTGKSSGLLHAASAAVLNAVKVMAKIPDKIDLLPRAVVNNISALKKDTLGMKSESLDVEEILIALSISATANPAAEAGMKELGKLNGCQMHLTHLPSEGDDGGLRRLGISMTTDANPTTPGYFLR